MAVPRRRRFGVLAGKDPSAAPSLCAGGEGLAAVVLIPLGRPRECGVPPGVRFAAAPAVPDPGEVAPGQQELGGGLLANIRVCWPDLQEDGKRGVRFFQFS